MRTMTMRFPVRLVLALFLLAAAFARPAVAAAEAGGYAWDKGVFTVPLTIRDNSGVARRAWPVTTGVPLPVGAVDDPRKLRLTDAAGHEIPAQFTVLGRYRTRDNSVRWVLLDTQVDVPAKGETVVQLRNDRPAAPVADPIQVTKGNGEIRVRTGALEAVVSTHDGSLLRSVAVGGKTVLQAGAGDGPALRSGESKFAEHFYGKAWNTHGWEKERSLDEVYVAEADYRGGTQAPDTVEIESTGPMHAVILIRGRYLPVGRGRGIIEKGIYRYTTRLHFYRGHSFIKVEHSVDNSDRAQPQWSYMFHEASLDFGLRLGGDAVVSGGGEEAQNGLPAAGTVRVGRGEEGWLYQAAGEKVGVNARTRGEPGGYRFGLGELGAIPKPVAAGARGRYLDISDGSVGVAVAMRYMWQEGPEAIALSPARARVVLHADSPGRKPDAEGSRPEYSLDFGERNLHDVLYYFHTGDAASAKVAAVAEAFEYPLFARAPTAWYSDSGAWYQEIAREPGDRTARGVEGDEHWQPDRVGIRGFGNPGGSYNSGGHHESLGSGWLDFMRTGALGALERNLVLSRWAMAHNPGWAYVDNVFSMGSGDADGLKALDRQIVAWDRLTAYGPKDFYLWRGDDAVVVKTRRGPQERRRGQITYLNGYKVLPDHEHYALFRLFEYYYLTGDRRALDAINGFVNWAVNFEQFHMFQRKTLPLTDTKLFERDHDALYRGHYSRVYTWMLYTTLAGYQATDNPVYDLYARWQVRRLLALLRDRHGQLTSARDATLELPSADGKESVRESRAQPWMEAQGVLALHEAYKAFDDERILDGLWGQADYFSHHVLFFPHLGMLNNWTAMPNRVLGTGEGKGNSLQPHRHDGYVQVWPLLYYYTGWPSVRERYEATEVARRTMSVPDTFMQTGLWQRDNDGKRVTQAPDAVTDLKVVSAGRSGITLQWTSPRAYGRSGRAERYFVKYSDKPIVEFAPTDNPTRFAARERVIREVEALAQKDPRHIHHKVMRVTGADIQPEAEPDQRWDPRWYHVDAFWMADHVAGEPKPAAPGSRETFTITEIEPHEWFGIAKNPGLEILPPGTYYIALCSWDEEHNLSRPSNVVKVELR